MRVLVVDDEIRLADSIARGLAAEGFDTDVVHDGREALWRAREADYAAIVLDIMLPGKNGYEVCRELRADGVTTPILMLTAKDGEYDEAEGLDTGADDYLRKPFSFVVLVARLRALLRRGAGAADNSIAVGSITLDPGPAASDRRRPLGRAHGPGVRSHRVPGAAHPGCGLEISVARFGVGSRLRRRPQHRRGVHRVSPKEARQGRDPHRARRRLPTDGRVVSRTPRGISMRMRLTVAMGAIAALAFAVVALAAPGVVRSVLEDDLLVAEAENAALLLTIDGPSTFDPEDLIDLADNDFFPVDSDVLIEVGGVLSDLFDGFDPFDIDSIDPDRIAAEQIALLRGIDRFDLLADAADGPFVIELSPRTGALVGADGSFEIVDDLGSGIDAGVPIMSAAELDELLFDDLGLRPTGADSVVGTDADGRPIAGVVDVDGTRLLVAADAAAVDRSVQRVQLGLWLGVPLLSALAAGLAWLLTSRALRPVAAITDRAATISGGSLDARVPVPASGDEISTLAVTVNEMLDRLEDDDRTRRRFVSDASHELRSPVAVMRNDAEVALEHPDTTDVRQLASVVAAESSRLSTIIDDLLALARHEEGVAPPPAEVDLDDLVLAEATRTRRVPVDTGNVSAGRVHGRRDELTRMVGHLIDNAARHATTVVQVSLRASPRVVELTVDDDGPGIDIADRDRIFERFSRLDDARTRDEGGAGLGLAVVRSTAERVGGTVTVGQAPIGGARFTVSFPR